MLATVGVYTTRDVVTDTICAQILNSTSRLQEISRVHGDALDVKNIFTTHIKNYSYVGAPEYNFSAVLRCIKTCDSLAEQSTALTRINSNYTAKSWPFMAAFEHGCQTLRGAKVIRGVIRGIPHLDLWAAHEVWAERHVANKKWQATVEGFDQVCTDACGQHDEVRAIGLGDDKGSAGESAKQITLFEEKPKIYLAPSCNGTDWVVKS
ncbi:hypothetical protein LTR37_021354 [Vermiconidia calcicola]|uniref:Uncharacterized protein n=1 Tax=Vermiconidia calcicola TaxID=1690605 RepID=A0ACC3MAQ0_9PEZI|nr:hypothetical protein LTR37_021354 [Vermiconidia calcicola]